MIDITCLVLVDNFLWFGEGVPGEIVRYVHSRKKYVLRFRSWTKLLWSKYDQHFHDFPSGSFRGHEGVSVGLKIVERSYRNWLSCCISRFMIDLRLRAAQCRLICH